jgi:enterochelin esterase-like enzyme
MPADLHIQKPSPYRMETHLLTSDALGREVTVDLYLPSAMDRPGLVSLLLINDGQDLTTMPFREMLDELAVAGRIRPLCCIGIHAGPDRKMEYGTAGIPDYMGRGARAGDYSQFVFRELLPFIRRRSSSHHFRDKSICGFSLGGLSALDIGWSHAHEFRHVGVFSGSLWWRSRALEDDYVDDRDRIIHDRIRKGGAFPWLKFYFEAGMLDESADRNANGVIDSVDDTRDLIGILEAKGYKSGRDIMYTELPDGRHDVSTWARCFPDFLGWAFAPGA